MKSVFLTRLAIWATSCMLSHGAILVGQTKGAEAAGAIEFRGVVSAGSQELLFSLYFKHSEQSVWLGPRQERGGLRVIAYDENAKALTVSYGGINQLLYLKEANEKPVPVIYSRKSKSGNHAEANPEHSHYHGNDEYHDQAPNPAAAKLVLEAVKKRQQMASAAGTSYTSVGTKTETPEQAISSDLPDEEAVTRNRVYNKDYAL